MISEMTNGERRFDGPGRSIFAASPLRDRQKASLATPSKTSKERRGRILFISAVWLDSLNQLADIQRYYNLNANKLQK
jgi:hypothetical protein